LLALLTLAAFWQMGDHAFINYDDNVYVTDNPQVKAGLTWEGVRWAFSTSHAANWHPLTWLSHMADVQLYGLSPLGHYRTNLLLHIANTLLLFLLLHRITGTVWRSAFVSALFALHPLRVESVAWIAERKDVLSALFGLLTLLAYARYVAYPAINSYLLSLGLFALGLMAKPMLVTLPCLLLLLDYWPLNRFNVLYDTDHDHRQSELKTQAIRLVLEKLPFLTLTAGSCIITYYAQSNSSVATLQVYPLLPRIGNALVAYMAYLGNFFYPVGLAVFYPIPKVLPPGKIIGATLLLTAVTIVVIRSRRKQPYLFTGWFWFLGTLVPVIGLVQVGMQAMADRYTYLPTIGIAIMLTWGIAALTEGIPYRRSLLSGAATATLVILTVITMRQLAYWQNSFTLFNHALAATENNPIAHKQLGIYFHSQQRYREAVQQYSRSLAIDPYQAIVHHNIGLDFAMLGDLKNAELHLLEATRINPNMAYTPFVLATVYSRQNRDEEAIQSFRETLRLDSTLVDAHYNLAIAYARQGSFNSAIQELNEVLRLAPGHVEACRNMAIFQQQLAPPQ
jgi:tetratricopeptide (TPR) repeat protein